MGSLVTPLTKPMPKEKAQEVIQTLQPIWRSIARRAGDRGDMFVDQFSGQEYIMFNNDGINWYMSRDPALVGAVCGIFRDAGVELLKQFDIWAEGPKGKSPVTQREIDMELAEVRGSDTREAKAKVFHQEMQVWDFCLSVDDLSKLDLTKLKGSLEAFVANGTLPVDSPAAKKKDGLLRSWLRNLSQKYHSAEDSLTQGVPSRLLQYARNSMAAVKRLQPDTVSY